MPTTDLELEEFLSSTPVDSGDSSQDHRAGTGESGGEAFQEEGYTGSVDYRIRQLSYSSLLTLHSCPRKFQLNRLRSTHRTEEDQRSSITFAYGHVVGEAIQLALDNRSEAEIIWRMFLMWHTDLLARDDKGNKSFWEAVTALQRFQALRDQGFLNEYELVYFDGRPAIELSFAIDLPDGFRLRGFVDAVLRNKINGKILVLECKTTGSATVNPATYKNSAQAIGYSIVLDHLFPEMSSYEVLYLIYTTKDREYNPIPFTKTYLQRALWIRELLLDVETIKLYEAAEVYPMRGESCFSFFRECEFFQTCTLSTGYLTKPCTPEEEDKTEYQVVISLTDLLDTQLEKLG
jgi:PD-(D/E)XK nuclease superfamily